MAISCSGKKWAKKPHGLCQTGFFEENTKYFMEWFGECNKIIFFPKNVAFIEFELENISLNMQSTNDCTLLHCNFASKDF